MGNRPTYNTKQTVAGNIEHPTHWSDVDETRLAFTQSVFDLGLNLGNILTALDVDRVGEYEGTVDEAIDSLHIYANEHRQDIREAILPQAPKHAEALALVFTEVYSRGVCYHVTARQGAIADDVVSVILAMSDGLDTLAELGFRTTKQPRAVAPPKVQDGPNASDFWKAARQYIGSGPDRPFATRKAVSNWLTVFSTGTGIDWVEAIKALSQFNKQE